MHFLLLQPTQMKFKQLQKITQFGTKKRKITFQWFTIHLYSGYSGCSLSRAPSVSNYFPGPQNISTKYTLIFSVYLEPLYLELLSISNENFGPVATILSLSRICHLHVLEFKLVAELLTKVQNLFNSNTQRIQDANFRM